MMEESDESKLQRIFVGNLPNNVKLNHLFSILPPGYDSSQVEIKHNYDIDKNITSSFAFVNLEGTPSQIKEWCDAASKKSVGGNVITVQFARLSFLERLKLEVSNEKAKKKSLNSSPDATVDPIVVPQSNKLFAISEPCSSESDVDDSDIQDRRSDKQPSSKCSTKFKTNDEAEVRRIESLKEKSLTQLTQKKLIRMALANKSKQTSNKIIFQNSDDESSPEVETSQNESKKRKLFGESDDDESEDEEVDFTLSKAKTKQIKTMISSVDERFRMDSKFFDEGDKEIAGTDDQGKDTEQNKLLQIADSIIETDPRVRMKVKSMKDMTTMPMRYDPLQKAHSSLVVRREGDIEEDTTKQIKPKPFKVTKDRFYDVSDNLTKQFQSKDNSDFSLLTLFGGENVALNESDQVNEPEVQNEKQFKTKNLKNLLNIGVENFFNVNENSESEDENNPYGKKSEGISKRSWYEPLFLSTKDQRVKDALAFFNSPPEDAVPHCVLRTHLKKIIKKKHRNNTAKVKLFKTKLDTRRKFRDKDNRKTNNLNSSLK